MHTYTMLAFDLDGTLTPSKQTIKPQMARRLLELLNSYQIAVIGGGKYEQFRISLVEPLLSFSGDRSLLNKLFLFPTCSCCFYRFNGKEFYAVYEEHLSAEEIQKITRVLETMIEIFDLHIEKSYGERIENRGTQVTFSMFGQEAPLEFKGVWDPDTTKRKPLAAYVQRMLPDFEVRMGGTSSIDVTRKGIDKGYGMRKIMECFALTNKDIVFFGDKLMEGGNDYPVKRTGVHCIAVENDDDTLEKLKSF
jgi:phosphomannomutase